MSLCWTPQTVSPPHADPSELFRDETTEATRILALQMRETLGLPQSRLETMLGTRHKLADIFRSARPW